MGIKSSAVKLKMTIACFRYDKGTLGLTYKLQKRKNQDVYSKLRQYKNIHEGKNCFIVGTGPSLTLEDVDKLNGQYSIGVNTLYKFYDKTDWRANYYCVIDPNTYGAIGHNLKKYHTDDLFIAGNRIKEKDLIVNRFSLECSSFYRMAYPQYFETPCNFSDDLSDEIYDGASVVYAAIQIAVYMGFKEIYLLGVDCNYDKNTILHNSDLGYGKNYKYNWTKQTGLTMIEGFKVAKKYADEHDIKIFNVTRGGMLDVFPRVDLDKVVR